MNEVIQYSGGTFIGSAQFAVFFDATEKVWNGTTLVAFTNQTAFKAAGLLGAVAGAETMPGRFVFAVPAGVGTPYRMVAFLQAGGSPATGDFANPVGQSGGALTADQSNTLEEIEAVASQFTFSGSLVNAQGFTSISGTVTSNTTVPIGQDITIPAANYWQPIFTITGLVSTGWSEFVFAIKRNAGEDHDAEALVLVKVTSGGSGSDGLVTLNGQPAATASLASMTVGSTTPDTTVTVTLQAGSLVIPPSDSSSYTYELVRWMGATRKERLATGQLTVERGVFRQTAAP